MGNADANRVREEMYTKCWQEERDHLEDLSIDGECSIKMSSKEIGLEGGRVRWLRVETCGEL